ncbi:hypothetical protein CPB83DRAFT_811363 [Crepidotus variabilis]|uniref:C2H2-type domain-containing protein n=1 Tax=Crepidotus variabilis TaxID=179855 RepID=A0A9P6JRS6_9AGAR|nr:hypothetical protein CPB83DRAFT_811363 [Crepidotus variabilis]
MPAIRTPIATPFGLKASTPYDTAIYTPHSEKAPFVRIHTPGNDLGVQGLEGYEDSLSQWMNVGPLFAEVDYHETSSCPPSFAPSPQTDRSTYEEPLEGNLFTWPYEAGHNNFESTYSVVPEMPGFSSFSPSTSLGSFSPRSDHSGLSLSPQPSDFSTALNFDYSTSLPSEFPSTSNLSQSMPSLSHSPKSTLSHSPSPSCSSLEAVETIGKRSKSRDGSPTRTPENDARRRFPCLIIGCERRFTSQYTLKVHMEAHKPKPRISFPCTLGCNERFSRQHDRLRHEVAKHGKVCEFSCEDCGRFFSTKKTLGNHKCPVAQGGTRWVTS